MDMASAAIFQSYASLSKRSRESKARYLTTSGNPLGDVPKQMLWCGYVTAGHSWVELDTSETSKTSNWVPVDPALGLVGDSFENMKQFKDMNYRGIVYDSIYADGLPETLGLEIKPGDLYFAPGESTHDGK